MCHVGIYVNGLVCAFNTEKVKPGSMPRSALDFLKPELKGQIITTYPHVDDVTLYLCLSQIKSAHIDDAIRPGPDGRICDGLDRARNRRILVQG